MPCMHCHTPCIQPFSRPLPTHVSTWDYWTFWVNLLCSHCSFLLGSVSHKVLFVPSKSLFPQSCVSFGGSVVGLMVTSSKSAYATPMSVSPRPPAPAAGHCWPLPPQETLKEWSESLWGLLITQGFIWVIRVSLAGMGFYSKCDFAPLVILLGLLICPWMLDIFSLVGSYILLLIVLQQ